MITVLKHNQEIIIICSKKEIVSIKKIRETIKTIKQINKTNKYSCKIMIRAFSNIYFTPTGKLFFNKIIMSSNFVNNDIIVVHE